MASTTEIELPLCPVRYVVVYQDRAEVTREVGVSLNAGEHEIQLKNISKAIDKDAVRVNGAGAASIMEVSFQDIPVTKECDNQNELKAEVVQLEEELADIERQLSSVSKNKERLTSQEELLNSYSDNLILSSKEAGTGQLVDRATIGNVFSLMDTFEKESIDLKEKFLDLELQEKKLSNRSEEVKHSLLKLRPQIKKDEDSVIKQPVIGILLAVKERGPIKLLVSYVVSNASWTPRYDLRVSSANRTMQVSYFGMIKQNTGEDWADTKLCLSTATPSVGGSAPELSTLRLNLVHFYGEAVARSRNTRDTFNDVNLDELRQSFRDYNLLESFEFAETTAKPSKQMSVPQAQVNQGLTSSVFEITSLATIPSDSSEHKVSVATIDLKPIFEYETVPKLSQHAFLKAKVKNDSQYSLLAGPANVFLDQSFVTKTALDSVSPQEEFSCSLGADPSVKVIYKPVHRYREESGLINVSVVYNYRQVTEITNCRSEQATVHFTDQIPLSKDEKLKVTLVEPVVAKVKLGQPAPNPNLTAQNHVSWSLVLQPGETKSLAVRYSVEYPKGKQIEGL